MPIQLDEKDQAIIKVLAKDGRKSFRQIAREAGISTPTAKARFNRLINIGFLKSVSPIFDFSKIEPDTNSITPTHQLMVKIIVSNQKLARI